MNASASGAERPDIRKGDLIKATQKVNSEDTGTGRVTSVSPASVITDRFYFEFANWDIEVLERPLPPIDEDLIRGVNKTYKEAAGYSLYGVGIKAVINYLREHDTYNKESK